jgi:hypothetical protein
MQSAIADETTDISTVAITPDMHDMMMHLSKMKRLDMKVSIDIAGLSNSAVRDSNGNLLPFVWTRTSINNEFENATLLTREALQRHLQGFIDSGVAANIAMLQKVSDPALLVDWLVRTSETWEQRYAAKRAEKFDISTHIISAMNEAVMEQILPWLQHFQDFDILVKELEKKIEAVTKNPSTDIWAKILLKHISAESCSSHEQQQESFFWIHRGNHALLRLLFRTADYTSLAGLTEKMCLVAGKLLQKQQTCERAGMYTSQRQRSDVVQLYNNAVVSFREYIQLIPPGQILRQFLDILEQPNWIFYIIDHTAVPVSLTDMRTPIPRLHSDTSENLVECPNCNVSFHLQDITHAHKRQKI